MGRLQKVILTDKDGVPLPSVKEALHGAETVQELYDALLWAKITYRGASRDTMRKWDKTAERIAERLRLKPVTVQGV